jgi:hypothetical protein
MADSTVRKRLRAAMIGRPGDQIGGVEAIIRDLL